MSAGNHPVPGLSNEKQAVSTEESGRNGGVLHENAASESLPAARAGAGARTFSEHDPASAPEMSYHAGPVQDHVYTSYPEVVPVGGGGANLGPQQGRFGNDKAQTQGDDGLQAVQQPYAGAYAPHYPGAPGQQHPQPGQQYPQPDQTGHQTAGMDGEQVPVSSAMPPANHNKIMGMKRRTFWIVIILLAIVVVAGAVGGGVGGALGSKKKTTLTSSGNVGQSPVSGAVGTTSASVVTITATPTVALPTETNNPTNTGTFVPFALATGIRSLPMVFDEETGVCGTPTTTSALAIYNCPAALTYVIEVEGSLQEGYTISNVSTNLPLFQNVIGEAPNGTDSNTDITEWLFSFNWEDPSTSCQVGRTTKFLLGDTSSSYGVVEETKSQSQCLLNNGDTAPIGQECNCAFISPTAS